jgi:hypothetical protein
MKIFKSWTFQWWEVGLIKLCLLSLGIILGIYYQDYLINFLSFWWILFAVIALYFSIKMIKKN